MNPPAKIVLASGNAGKLREFSQILADFQTEVIPQGQLGVEEAEETGLSFIENSLLKARNAARQTGLPAIADDSGIAVDALNGAPGIYSARYAGVGASDADNLNKLLAAMQAHPTQRSARFHCVISFVRHADDPVPLLACASWAGEITAQISGNNGFGYDPIFWLPSHRCTSADLDSTEKNRISHRGQASRQFLAQFQHHYGQ